MLDKRLVNQFLAIVIATSLSGCQSSSKEEKNSGRQSVNLSVEGVIVEPVVLDQIITISGTLKPFEETVLMPEVSGRVVYINLSEGGFVRQGTLLVKLFNDDLQAQLKKSLAQLKIVEQTEFRQNELVKVNGISQLDFDQTVLQINSINADIEVLKAQIRKTEVHAPFDGTIGLRNISIGAQVTPGTALATIRDVKHLKLDFSVPEKYSREIKPGVKVQFTVQGDEKKYDATVIATEQGIESGTRNLNGRALVDNNINSLIPGTFANVDLSLNQNKGALMVPTQSVIPQERTKQLIVAKNGRAKFVTVKTGIRNVSSIEILSGITTGDTVVTTGVLFLKPDAVLNFSSVRRDTI
jgi:membrane fusion protein (multidrug efflux system)